MEVIEPIYFSIPFAPVSVNDAYGIRSVSQEHHSYAFKYLKDHYKRLKEVMKEILASQDPGYDLGPYIRAEYLFLYVSEEVFIPADEPHTIKNYSGSLIDDPELYRKDVSNSFKLVEDALFEYLRKDDTRSIDVVGYKRACKKLPMQLESYNGCKVKMPKGCILIRVEAMNDKDIFLKPGDAVYKTFSPALKNTGFVPEDRDKTKIGSEIYPEWYKPGEQPDSGADIVEDIEAYSKASSRVKGLIIRDMVARRIKFACDALECDEADVAELMLRTEPLRTLYREVAPKGIKTREQAQEFFSSSEWALSQLRSEASDEFAESLRAIEWMLNGPVKRGSSVLVVGAGSGGLLYPFASKHIQVTATELVGVNHSLLVSRVKRDALPVSTRSVSWYDQMKGLYDAVVLLGVTDIDPDLYSLLREAAGHLKLGGYLVTDCTFKRYLGKKLTFPWVQDSDIDGMPRSKAFRDFLLRKTNGRLGLTYATEDWLPRHKVKFWRKIS